MNGSALSLWGFSTPAMDEIFAADRVVAAILRFEAALALALADVGIAPEDEAEAVASACETQMDDPEALLASTWETGTPLISITDEIRSRLASDGERRWVHYGATTQDAIDTAHVLLAREALQTLDAGLAVIGGLMRDLVVEFRDQPQMARTLLQDALPTTFGWRVAGWLDPLLTHLESMRETRAGLALQLGGPVGNLATYGSHGTAVIEALAQRLGLEAPLVPWHTDRSRIRAMVNVVQDALSSLAKVAGDVILLAQSSVGEVTTRPGGSSSMPHKRNPVDAVRALAATDVSRGAAAMVREGRPHELDRALGTWQSEWVAVPLMFSSASAVVDAITALLEGLEIDRSAMESGVGEKSETDTTMIDAVLDHFTRVIGGT